MESPSPSDSHALRAAARHQNTGSVRKISIANENSGVRLSPKAKRQKFFDPVKDSITIEEVITIEDSNESGGGDDGKHAGDVEDVSSEHWPTFISAQDRGVLLSCTGWLNDGIVDTAMEMIAALKANLRTVSSTIIVAATTKTGDDSLVPETMRVHLRDQDITILLPLNIGNSHWLLAYLVVASKSAVLVNSMTSDLYTAQGREMVSTFVTRFLPGTDWSQWTFTPSPSPQQPNSSDCGVYTIAAAFYLAASIPLPNTLDGALWRRVILAMMPPVAGSDPAPAPLLTAEDMAVENRLSIATTTTAEQDPLRPGTTVDVADYLHEFRRRSASLDSFRASGISQLRSRRDACAARLDRLRDVGSVVGALLAAMGEEEIRRARGELAQMEEQADALGKMVGLARDGIKVYWPAAPAVDGARAGLPCLLAMKRMHAGRIVAATAFRDRLRGVDFRGAEAVVGAAIAGYAAAEEVLGGGTA